MRQVTPATIEQLTADHMALVDFWASWCGPCQMMEPVLAALDQEFGAEINFGKLNVEKYQDFAVSNNIMSIPALILYVDGQPKEKVTGYRELAAMRAYLKRKLAEYPA